jgi:hypothetical protein
MTINQSIEKISNKLILERKSNNTILRRTLTKLKELKEKVGGDSKLSEQSIKVIKKLIED